MHVARSAHRYHISESPSTVPFPLIFTCSLLPSRFAACRHQDTARPLSSSHASSHVHIYARVLLYNFIEYLYILLIINFAEELIPILNERAGFPPDTELALYEEIKPNLVEKIDNLTEPLEKVLEELMDGDIIVFQKEGDNEMYELPTCREYFK